MPIYMKYEGVTGSETGKFAGWIELDSCQIGSPLRNGSISAGVTNGRQGTADVSEILITKAQDKTSTQLFMDSVQGTSRSVKIVFVEANGAPYLDIDLKNTIISSITIGGYQSSGQIRPTESISLSFEKIVKTPKPAAPAKDPKQQKAQAMWNLNGP